MNGSLIAVIGAGSIGSDVALDLALHQYRVLLKDLSEEILAAAEDKMRQSHRFTKMMKKGKPIPSLEETLGRIKTTTDYGDFPQADQVIENISEDYDAKKELYEALVNVCRPDVIYGVNTSCISITKIAALTPRPENVIGMHFMNPVPLSKLVEVVKGYHTSDETVQEARQLVKSLHKTCVVVNDHPGFVTNRVMMLTINECIHVLQDQVADARAIDTVFKMGFGHKMGPLATADLIGLDTILNSLMVLYESYNDPKYRPCPLLKKMVHAGLLGKKSGKGFFAYGAEPK
jgi:3-hydroxybutyryl-CoA dehydrogenase